jgi:hypothetical protein
MKSNVGRFPVPDTPERREWEERFAAGTENLGER